MGLIGFPDTEQLSVLLLRQKARRQWPLVLLQVLGESLLLSDGCWKL